MPLSSSPAPAACNKAYTPGRGSSCRVRKPGLHKRPVLPYQGNQITHSADGNQVTELFQQFRRLTVIQTASQLKGHAHPAKIRKGQLIVRSVGVHHGLCAGQLLSYLVVVSHHQLHTQPIDILCLVHRRNTVIHRDNQAGAFGGQGVNAPLFRP